MKKELLFCGNSRHKFNKFLIPSDAALMRWIKYLPCCFLQNNSKLFFLSIRFTTPSTENFHSLFPSIAAIHRFPLVFFSFRFYFSTFQVFLLYFIHPPNPSLPSRLNRSLLLPPTCRFTPPNAHSHTTQKKTHVRRRLLLYSVDKVATWWSQLQLVLPRHSVTPN